MLNNLTPDFLIAMAADDREPITLAVFHFLVGDVYLADRDLVISGKVYEGLVEDWGDKSTVGGENAVASTEQMTITIWNGGENPFSDYLENEDPVNVFVDVYQTYEGLVEADFAHVGEFVIQDPIETSEASSLLTLDIVTTNMRYSAQIGQLMTKAAYPDALSSDINKSIDLIVGEPGEVECPCSKKPPSVTMSGSILRTPTTIYTLESLHEANFPNTGYIWIEEEKMYYDNITEYSLNVVVRGASLTKKVDHQDGATIIADGDFEFIVGQGPLGSVDDIRAGLQVPTVPYEAFPGQNPAIIRFAKQPTYTELEASTTNIISDFDASGDDNTASNASWAYDPENPALGAIIGKDERLSLVQYTPAEDDGAIVRVFLAIDHWANKSYSHNAVNVYVDGVGFLGKLTKPNAQDITALGGEVDLYHGHDHEKGGDHTHDSTDPVFDVREPGHPHGIFATRNRSYMGNPYESVSFGYTSSWSNVVQYTHYFDFDRIPGKIEDGSVRVTLDTSGTPSVGYVTEVQIYLQYYSNGWRTFPESITSYSDIWAPGGRTFEIAGLWWNISSNFHDMRLKVVSFLAVNDSGTIHALWSNPVLAISTRVQETYDADSDVYQTKPGDGEVEQNREKVKAVDDVKDLPEETKSDLEITLQEESSRSVTQKFDLTNTLATINWNWLHNNGNGRKAYLQYWDAGTGEDAEVIVTYMRFEVEYRKRVTKSTESITCKPVGTIDNRPDAVIEYLLTEKAGLPADKLGSVYRSVPKWDDNEIWDDNDVWIDEGQVTGAVEGAAFEEASAWFDYHGYKIDGVLSGAASVRETIPKITWQTRSKLTWQNGQAKLSILRRADSWSAAKDIPYDDIQLQSYTTKRSPASDIVNKIDIFHTIDRLSEASGVTKYRETASAQDNISIGKHGERSKNDMWLFDLVRDGDMAEHVAAYYVWELGETYTLYGFNTYLKHFDIEKTDYISISSYNIAKLNKLVVTASEIVRVFGSLKLSRINLLKMVCKSIRHRRYIQNPTDSVNVNDTIETIIGFDFEFSDSVSISEIFDLVVAKELSDSVAVGDLQDILLAFRSKFFDQAEVGEEVGFEFGLNINDQIEIVEDFYTVDKLCFGACGFGGPNCEIPFGSATIHEANSADVMSATDTIGFGIGLGLSEDVVLDEKIAFGDGFGCAAGIGSGFGYSPFGC